MIPSGVHCAFTFLWFDGGVSEPGNSQTADGAQPEVLLDRVAFRIRSLSSAERDLAAGLAALRSPPAPGFRLVHPAPPSTVETTLLPSATAVGLLDPGDDPTLDDDLWEPVAIDGETTSSATPQLDAPLRSEWIEASAPVAAPASVFSTGPFDDLLVALTAPPKKAAVPTGPLPPAERFRVRVARVTKSDRSTKRNYDYFEELEASLRQLKQQNSVPDA